MRRPGPIGAVALALGLIVAACGGGEAPVTTGSTATGAPSDDGAAGETMTPGRDDGGEIPDLDDAAGRAVAVATAACGAADPAEGSGIAIGPDRVLTAAHVVASGGTIELTAGGAAVAATLLAYDPARDLALVRPVDPLDHIPPRPVSGSLAVDDTGTIVGASRSGDLPATVELVTIIEMDDVRSTTRSQRRGYRVDAATGPGDSGSGLYDEAGRLVGLVFAVSSADDDRTWVTAASEIEAFLVDPSVRGAFACDPERSRIARTGEDR